MFEWDERKASTNVAKHGVAFDEAMSVFEDEDAFDGPDVTHSSNEPRFLRLGRSAEGRVLTVCYTVRRSEDDKEIRIISARRANREEELGYVGTQD